MTHRPNSLRDPSQTARMQSVTLKYGKTTRRFVLSEPPFAKVGDIVRIKGGGVEWTVTKVRELDPSKSFSISFPKAEGR